MLWWSNGISRGHWGWLFPNHNLDGNGLINILKWGLRNWGILLITPLKAAAVKWACQQTECHCKKADWSCPRISGSSQFFPVHTLLLIHIPDLPSVSQSFSHPNSTFLEYATSCPIQSYISYEFQTMGPPLPQIPQFTLSGGQLFLSLQILSWSSSQHSLQHSTTPQASSPCKTTSWSLPVIQHQHQAIYPISLPILSMRVNTTTVYTAWTLVTAWSATGYPKFTSNYHLQHLRSHSSRWATSTWGRCHSTWPILTQYS